MDAKRPDTATVEYQKSYSEDSFKVEQQDKENMHIDDFFIPA